MACSEIISEKAAACKSQRVQRWLLALLLVAAAHAALAQDAISQAPVLPAMGSINSVEMADRALLDAAQERQQFEARYIEEQDRCYDKFFVSHCLAQAAERHRLELNRIRPVEVEANAYKRRAKVDARDENLALQRERDQQDAAQRATQQREAIISSQKKVERGAQGAQAAQAKEKLHEGDADKRIAEHNARLQDVQQQEAAGAAERAQNVADFEKKRLASEARQREVAAKKAEKERKREAGSHVPAVPVAPPVQSAPTDATGSKP